MIIDISFKSVDPVEDNILLSGNYNATAQNATAQREPASQRALPVSGGYITNKPIDTDPTADTEAQLVDYLNSLQSQEMQINQSEEKRQKIQGMIDYQHPAMLKNDDFYVQTSPLVAGSISGRIIGTQLITGGADATRMPMAPYQYERERLMNTILNAIKPSDKSKTPTATSSAMDSFTQPEAGVYSEQFRNLYKEGAKKFLDIAGRHKDGYKLLHTKGNPLNEGFNTWNGNMTYVANNLTSVVKKADELAKQADEYGLSLPREIKRDVDLTRNGLVDIVNGGNPNYSIQEKLRNATLGMSAVQVAKDIKDQTIASLETEIRNATEEYALSKEFKKYHDLLETKKTEGFLNPDDYFYQKKIDKSKATKEEYDAALRYNAENLVRPRILAEYGDLDGNVDKDGEKALKYATEMVYQQMKNIRKDIDMKAVGATPINVNASANAKVYPKESIEIPEIGAQQQTILDIQTNGYGLGANNTVHVLLPNGDIKSSSADGRTRVSNADDAMSLTTSMLTAEGGKNLSEVKNSFFQKPELRENLTVSVGKIKTGFKSFPDWWNESQPGKVKKALASADMMDFSKYLESNKKASLIMNNDIIKGIDIKRGNGDKINGVIVNKGEYVLQFITNDGRTVLPAYSQQEAIEKKATKIKGTNTKGVWVSEFPKQNKNGAFAVVNEETGEISVYEADGTVPISTSRISVYKEALKSDFISPVYKSKPVDVSTEHAQDISQSGKNKGTANNATVAKKY